MNKVLPIKNKKLTNNQANDKLLKFQFDLFKENQELEVVFWNELLDDNHWGCILSIDDVNKKELCISPTIQESE